MTFPDTGKLATPSPVLYQVAALTQILDPEPAAMRLGFVKYLSEVPQAEATQALGRLALFSPEREVRQAAVCALKERPRSEYADILLHGMRYPWPAVADRAADALVSLNRHDLLPQLVDLLDEPDPRAPVLEESGQGKVPVVRELVRINHNRNCLLCHAPADDERGLTAPIPKLGESLVVRHSLVFGYNFSREGRTRVKEAEPWPRSMYSS